MFQKSIPMAERSAADRLLALGVRIPPELWMSLVSVVCVVRVLCDGPITRLEESN